MAEPENSSEECPRLFMEQGELSPNVLYNVLIPMLDNVRDRYNWKCLAYKLMPIHKIAVDVSQASPNNLTWELIPLRQMDLDRIEAAAKNASCSPVEVMIRQYYELHGGVIDGRKLWHALKEMGRNDVITEIERAGNIFVDQSQPTNYEIARQRTVSHHVHETVKPTDGHLLTHPEYSRPTISSQAECSHHNDGHLLTHPEHSRPTTSSQAECSYHNDGHLLTHPEHSRPTTSSQAECSCHTEQTMETHSDVVSPGNNFVPVPLQQLSRGFSFVKTSKKKHRYQNSTSQTMSTMSSDDAMDRSSIVEENSSQFENFDGVVRRCHRGQGSLENAASRRKGPQSHNGSNMEEKILVGISYTEQDRSLAEKLVYHLEYYGCTAVLIGKDLLNKLHKIDAILVIYSYHYKEQLNNRPVFWKKHCIWSVFQFLSEEHSKKRGNQRCVFYPTFNIGTNQKLPSIFHNSCPRKDKARHVFRLLFRKVQKM